jgi:hypothetical protein
MATLKSTERCTATAALYSGRPDPRWSLDEDALRDLEKIWRELQPAKGAAGGAPGLGYRGCTVDCGARGVWMAYGRVVSRGNEHRIDAGRRFERAVLRSAPQGAIPAEVLRMIEAGAGS